MIPRRWIAAAAFALGFLPAFAQGGGRVVIPRAWQDKLQNSPWDTNHNQVDDALEALGPGSTVELIVDLNACLDAAARARLSAFGTIDYEAINFPILHMAGVPFAQLIPLAQDPIVAFLEHDEELHHTLDVSNPALQVKPSAAYPAPPAPGLPITVHEKYPGIFGGSAAIAIVDTGIDDVLGPGTVHQSLQRFNGGLTCPGPLPQACVELNPDDTNGSGSHVAGIVLGEGEGGVDAPHQGLAPWTSMYDVKLADFAGPTGAVFLTSRLIKVLDAIASRIGSVQWQLQTILLPWSGCTPSNGTDALSQAVNQMWGIGETVITGIGNCSSCMAVGTCTSCPCNLVAAPAAADHVITVGFSDDHGTVSRADDTLSQDSLRGPRLSDGDGDTADERKPDFVAPGVNISSAQFNTVGGYVNRSGSSAAAAHAAGCSALVWDIANKRQFDVQQIFIETAEDHGGGAWDPGWGAGILNCFAAVDYVNNFACASLRFVGTCGGFGQPPCGLHPGLHAANWFVEGVRNTVTADITNDGPGFTLPYSVKMRVDSFSNGDNSSEICSLDMPPLAPGASAHPSCDWTPGEIKGTPPGVVHACLYADIISPTDCSAADNEVQHNEEIQQAFSPATAAMFVENPSNEAVMIALSANFDCGGFSCHGWSFAPSDNFFSMMPDDCPVKVVLEASPFSADAVRRAQVHVKTYGQNQFGGVSDLGSVTLTAHLACPPRNLTWAPLSKSRLTWLPPAGWDACLDTTFDVARGALPILRYPSTTKRGDYTAAVCLADEQAATTFIDSAVPPSGTGFYYLVRSGGPAPGSWDSIDSGQRGRADDTLHTCADPQE